MARGRTDQAGVLAAGVVLALLVPSCGKKAPLRLTEDRPALEAAVPRARVREGRVTLDFAVPRHRLFPEREEPWVLARILRQSGGTAESPVEVGAILESGGFAFGAPQSWTDREQPSGGSFVYRVEFRDAVRRRRALSGPVSVSWNRTPGTPQGLLAVGGMRSVALTWSMPETEEAGARFAVYRREPPERTLGPVSPEPVTESRYVDSRVETGREYCYAIRAVLTVQDIMVEGPAGTEACARTTSEPPPVRPGDSAP